MRNPALEAIDSNTKQLTGALQALDYLTVTAKEKLNIQQKTAPFYGVPFYDPEAYV